MRQIRLPLNSAHSRLLLVPLHVSILDKIQSHVNLKQRITIWRKNDHANFHSLKISKFVTFCI